MLHKLYSFNLSDEDMVTIYTLYIRSILEQSCQVWHFSITHEEKADIERVQKAACKVILGERYSDYPSALDALNLDSLATRRQTLSLKFAKFNQTKDMFSLNNNDAIDVRHRDKFQVQFAKGSRLLDSAIPQLQRALNDDAKS